MQTIVCIFVAMRTDYDAKKIGSKVSDLRKSNGLSVRRLAKEIGITDTALAKIESGDTKSITIGLGKEISKVLNVPFNELFEIEVFQDGSLIEELKTKNERLEKENERLLRELDNYQIFINLLKNKNMITSPREEIKGENRFEVADDHYLKQAIGKMGAQDKETLLTILNTPDLKKACEDGTMKDSNMKRVWEEYQKSQSSNPV